MDLKEFLKLRYNFLKTEYDNKNNDLVTQIRINAKFHELKLIMEFMNSENTDNIFELR